MARLACLSVAVFGLAFTQAPALAQSPPGDLIVDSRVRYETVDQDGLSDAVALTWRTRLGWESPQWSKFKVLVEAETVTALVDDYNDTINGRVRYPVIADPETAELNRAQITWTGLEDTEVVLGRQRLILNNARFVGNVGFRQNEQTFDAVTVRTRAFAPLTLTYAYIDRVHRIFGDDSPQGEWDSDSHVIQVNTPTPAGELSGYGYLLAFDEAPGQSSATWGARLKGSRPVASGWIATYALEYARQSEYGDNPAAFDLDYVAVEGGLGHGPLAGSLAMERLDGDGARAFQTPLATLHAFQGWADVFLVTPPNGIRDLMASASYTITNPPLVQAVTLSATWHDFDDADGSVDYGQEFDAVARFTLNPRWSAEIKGARFDGALPAFADRTKVWASVEFKF